MTQKLYETDAYVQEFAAAVLSCTPAKGGYAVVLDRTPSSLRAAASPVTWARWALRR